MAHIPGQKNQESDHTYCMYFCHTCNLIELRALRVCSHLHRTHPSCGCQSFVRRLGMVVKFRTDWFSQERIVFLLAAILFLVASFSLKGFFTPDNLVAIVRSVSVLGILAVGMAIVIIGRGIDLSAVAIMAMSVAWYLAAAEQRNCRTDRTCACPRLRPPDRSRQRLPRRLCRCPGDFRHAWRAAPSSSASCARS